MSKKNILEKISVGNTIHVTFDANDGKRTYEYKGSSARALKKGTDPGNLSGRLIKHEKKKD